MEEELRQRGHRPRHAGSTLGGHWAAPRESNEGWWGNGGDALVVLYFGLGGLGGLDLRGLNN